MPRRSEPPSPQRQSGTVCVWRLPRSLCRPAQGVGEHLLWGQSRLCRAAPCGAGAWRGGFRGPQRGQGLGVHEALYINWVRVCRAPVPGLGFLRSVVVSSPCELSWRAVLCEVGTSAVPLLPDAQGRLRHRPGFRQAGCTCGAPPAAASTHPGTALPQPQLCGPQPLGSRAPEAAPVLGSSLVDSCTCSLWL